MPENTVAAGAQPPRGLSYAQVRALLVIAGLALLAVTVVVSYARRVETVEVVAILLFIPIFIAVILWDWVGGVIAALGAMAVYISMRSSAIHAVGAGKFAGVILTRSLAFLAFGLVGGIANEQLRSSLRKLDLYDQVDSATGLFNARFFVTDTDLEMSRASRYQSIFSVCALAVPTAAFDGLGRRPRQRAIRELGRLLATSVRTVDRAVHGVDTEHHRVAVVLPETGAAGARVFADRLLARVRDYLTSAGVTVDGRLDVQALTFPQDADALQQLRARFAEIDAREHPTSS